MPALAQRVVDAAVVVLPEIHVVEPVAVAQPGLGAVARVQEGERRADREALIAHRGKHEHLVERQGLGEQPVEPHVGEQPARQRELARAGAPEPPAAPIAA